MSYSYCFYIKIKIPQLEIKNPVKIYSTIFQIVFKFETKTRNKSYFSSPSYSDDFANVAYVYIYILFMILKLLRTTIYFFSFDIQALKGNGAAIYCSIQ